MTRPERRVWRSPAEGISFSPLRVLCAPFAALPESPLSRQGHTLWTIRFLSRRRLPFLRTMPDTPGFAAAIAIDKRSTRSTVPRGDVYASPILPLELLAPRQFSSRWFLRSSDGGRLHLAIAHIGRVDEPVRRDNAVREPE